MVGGAQQGAVGAAAEPDHDLVWAEGDVTGGGDEAAPDGVWGGGLGARQAGAQGVVGGGGPDGEGGGEVGVERDRRAERGEGEAADARGEMRLGGDGVGVAGDERDG